MQKQSRKPVARLVLGLLTVGLWGGLEAAQWPQWRGPNFDGSTEAKNLPVTFSKTENVVWSAAMPGPSAATPVILGDCVFVSSVDAETRSTVAISLDRKTGKELWRHKVLDGDRLDNRSNYSAPSPIAGDKFVWFFYGNGELVCFEHGGKEVWRRNVQKDYGQFAFQWTFSASPLLHDGTLYVQVLQRDVPVNGRGRTDGPIESFLLALNPETGKELWRHVRPNEAKAESKESYSTPVPFVHQGRTEILISGGDDITGHDPKTGRELWRWGTWNEQRIGHWRLVPSPVAGGGVVLACGPKGAPVFAVKAGLNGKQDNSALAWTSTEREVSTDVSTPLFYRGSFYILNSDRKTLARVEPATGKVLWTGTFPTRDKIEASPTAADGKIYVMSHGGDVFVLEAGDAFKVLHSAKLAEDGERDLRASIAIADDRLFVRTDRKLHCLGAN